MKDDKETRYNTIENIIISILKKNIDKKDIKEIIPLLNVKIKRRMGLISSKKARQEIKSILSKNCNKSQEVK